MSIINIIKGEEPNFIEKLNFMFKHNFDIGQYGEYLISYAFKDNIINGLFSCFNNVYIPYKNKTSEIDVLLIHETGIYVFESKNYSGWIFGSEQQKEWTQSLNKYTKSRFYNPIKQNQTHIKALSNYLKIDNKLMKSYIVFSERCELNKIPNNTKEYTIIKRNKLLEALKKDIQDKEKVFTQIDINLIADKVKPLTNVSEEKKQKHIDNIKKTLH